MTRFTPKLLPEGLRDRLPDEAEAASRVTRALIDVMSSHGYRRIARFAWIAKLRLRKYLI